MSEPLRRYTGWFVPFPVFLRVEPQSPTDLVSRFDFEGFGFGDDLLYNTEAAAWADVRKHLADAHSQCLKDLEFLKEPLLSPDGKTRYIVPETTLEEMRAQVRKELRIIEKGLSLCPKEGATAPAPS